MNIETYKQAKIIKLKNHIEKIKEYLNNQESFKHRNIRKQQERDLINSTNKLNRFLLNNLNDEDIYFFNELYKNKEVDLNNFDDIKKNIGL